MSEIEAKLNDVSLAGPPATATDGPTVAKLAAEAGVPGAFEEGADLRPLVELADALGAAGAANLLVPHVVLPALLAPGLPLDGATTVALGEGDDDFALDSVECRLEGGALGGPKPLVSAAAGFAKRALVAARADGVVLVGVDLDAEGVEIEPVPTIGRGGDANLAFSGVTVGEDAVLADSAELAERLERAAQFVALVQAAEGRGMLRAMLDLAVKRGIEREAFGRPIGSFQAFQHACADMAMDLELASALVDHGAAVPTLAGALQARLFVADAAVAGSRAALQLQGGMGFLDDHPVARLYRQAKEAQLRWGSTERQLDAVWDAEVARAGA
jgi:alkylation response protein AidB-like acyl-CoA dehydrogenase